MRRAHTLLPNAACRLLSRLMYLGMKRKNQNRDFLCESIKLSNYAVEYADVYYILAHAYFNYCTREWHSKSLPIYSCEKVLFN